MSLRRLMVCFLVALAAPSAAFADDLRIIGDSIGEGVHLATNLPSPANRFNVAIYTAFIFKQLSEMPRGATVFMSLGTNDAVGGAAALDVHKRVEQIVAAAEAQGVKLYWLGPPCVLKPWEIYAKKLDEILAAQLAGGSATYVSLQDASFCERSLHAPDGVHFTMAGYARMWQIAASAAGIPVVVAAASEHKTVANVGKKAPGKKKYKKKAHVAAPAAPRTPAPK
ncbi:MAG: GDSL-type esterase/lipase family protein [Roseiarcus sp.]